MNQKRKETGKRSPGLLQKTRTLLMENQEEKSRKQDGTESGLYCHRCANTDPAYFGKDHGLYYCRKCLDFGRLPAGVPVTPARLSQRVWKGSPVLEFELTPLQKKASRQALEVLQSGRDALIFAAAVA